MKTFVLIAILFSVLSTSFSPAHAAAQSCLEVQKMQTEDLVHLSHTSLGTVIEKAGKYIRNTGYGVTGSAGVIVAIAAITNSGSWGAIGMAALVLEAPVGIALTAAGAIVYVVGKSFTGEDKRVMSLIAQAELYQRPGTKEHAKYFMKWCLDIKEEMVKKYMKQGREEEANRVSITNMTDILIKLNDDNTLCPNGKLVSKKDVRSLVLNELYNSHW